MHSDLKGILKENGYRLPPIIYSMVWESHVKYLQSWQLIMI